MYPGYSSSEPLRFEAGIRWLRITYPGASRPHNNVPYKLAAIYVKVKQNTMRLPLENPLEMMKYNFCIGSSMNIRYEAK